MIAALIVGLIVGALAKLFMPGKDPGGIIITMLIGIVGAYIAFFIGHFMGFYASNETPGWIASIIGAMLLLWGYRVFRGPRTTRLG